MYNKVYKAVEMFIFTENPEGKDNGRTIAEIVLRENLDYLRYYPQDGKLIGLERKWP